MVLIRIKSQNVKTLSCQIYEECKAREWPGLGEEVTEICREIDISDVNEVVVSKEEIKDAIWNHHQSDIQMELNNSKKLNDVKDEDFSKVQAYFENKSVENTRMAFKVRSKMVADIPGISNRNTNKRGQMVFCVHIVRRGRKWTKHTACTALLGLS